ncbi:MAG: PilT/PilU family type 4a pilus ATPase [Proteobacteria bacterium]|jgi:twitching motility protein PilT|nr:PilT/PilU family type 4a pilus ATPase [Pseudomonadota bacterium]
MTEKPKRPAGDDDLEFDLEAITRGNRPPPPPPDPGRADGAAEAVFGLPSARRQAEAADRLIGSMGKAGTPIKADGGMLGKILVDNGFLTPKQRDECLALQARPGNALPFGEIAIEQCFISRELLDRVLEAQRSYNAGVHRRASVAPPAPPALAAPNAEKMRDVGQMLIWLGSTLKHQASDLHLMSGKPPILRQHGNLVPSKDKPIDAAAAEGLLTSLLTAEERRALEHDHSVTKCLDLPGGARARACIFRHMRGTNGVFRLIPDRVPSLVALNLPPVLGKFTTYAQGLVLVTGPIGSGKTTTLAALVDIINSERHQHIITIEDPIEFVHANRASLITQRQVGRHTGGFAVALRAALREDPDVIVVGEMHDRETAQLAVTAAETGHLVFATLHTQNAIRSINRVLDLFPAEEQGQVRTVLAETLRGVVSQQLVPRADVPGRVPVVELLFVTPAIRNLIREQKVHQMKNALRISRAIGNLSVEDHAAELLAQKLISEQAFKLLKGQ